MRNIIQWTGYCCDGLSFTRDRELLRLLLWKFSYYRELKIRVLANLTGLTSAVSDIPAQCGQLQMSTRNPEGNEVLYLKHKPHMQLPEIFVMICSSEQDLWEF
jgi:hypothetical protein